MYYIVIFFFKCYDSVNKRVKDLCFTLFMEINAKTVGPLTDYQINNFNPSQKHIHSQEALKSFHDSHKQTNKPL